MTSNAERKISFYVWYDFHVLRIRINGGTQSRRLGFSASLTFHALKRRRVTTLYPTQVY